MAYDFINQKLFVHSWSVNGPQSAIAADGKICPSGKKSGVIYIYTKNLYIYIYINFSWDECWENSPEILVGHERHKFLATKWETLL